MDTVEGKGTKFRFFVDEKKKNEPEGDHGEQGKGDGPEKSVGGERGDFEDGRW